VILRLRRVADKQHLSLSRSAISRRVFISFSEIKRQPSHLHGGCRFYEIGKCYALSYFIKTLREIALRRTMKMLLAQPPQAMSFASEPLCS